MREHESSCHKRQEFDSPSIGPIRLWPPVVLAPMAGVTDFPFRDLCRSFMAKGLKRGNGLRREQSYVPGLFVNQMITARAFVEGNAKTLRLAEFADGEEPRSIQLYGTDPDSLEAAVRKLVALQEVEHIDLNFGCPVPKVTRHGGGGALPYRRPLFRRIIRSVVSAANGEIPVTVKFRMGIDDSHITFLDAGKIAEDEGVAAIALHARTVEQLYSGHARWDAITELKQHVQSIPIFGNGDIWEADDAIRMMHLSNADGVVIGRGCLGRPWLFQQLAEIFSGVPPSPVPTLGEVGEIMLNHAEAVVCWNGSEDALRTFRKHASWYLTGFAVGKNIRREIQQVASLEDLDRIVGRFDPDLTLPREAYRIPRSHKGGPKKVSLPDGWLNEPFTDLTLGEEAEQITSGG
ncbi:MAG: tRNA dihydrouridine synthase DusB [Actinomycetota bacterium]|nr:tRNA dihydrouridine synthase DusB [Actinomycetota bacterium]